MQQKVQEVEIERKRNSREGAKEINKKARYKLEGASLETTRSS
jgi:hypothetical protein